MSVKNNVGLEEDSIVTKEDPVKRSLLSKFAANHGERKFPTVLTGDFDKNLTIEKARFDSNTKEPSHTIQPPVSSTSTPLSALQQPVSQVVEENDTTVTPNVSTTGASVKTLPLLTTSVTLPIVPTLQTINGPSTPTNPSNVSTIPSQSTPLLTKSSKPKTDRSVKRKKLPPMNGTATPSEVFHRNLVDAVSNVEDSDENEQYVYPYSGNNTDTTANYHMNPTDTIHRTTSSLYRPQSTRSFANSYQSQNESLFRKASRSFFGGLFSPILLTTKSESKTLAKQSKPRSEEHLGRPKLRSYVMDHQTKLSQTNSDWMDGPPLHSASSSRRPSYSRQFYSNYGIGDGGYMTDDEEAQNLLPTTRRKTQPYHNRHKKRKGTCTKFIQNTMITLSLLVLSIIACTIYLAKPLRDLSVGIGRVLSSDKELIFDLHINAINSNFWTIRVADADISVFAFSQVVANTLDEPITRGADPAEYLGGFYHFDEPLSFISSFYTKKPSSAISQIRIKSPGADKSGNERWSRIIRYPYGLVIRGVLKYKLISFLSPYPQSAAICNVVRIDPTTGKISEDPDQGYCLTVNTDILLNSTNDTIHLL